MEPSSEEFERGAREGSPHLESTAVRAHSKDAFSAFANSWAALFRNLAVAHPVKERCRVHVSRSVRCGHWENQRNSEVQAAGLEESQLDDLWNFESSIACDERPRAALPTPKPSRGAF